MSPSTVTFHLSRDEALVLFEWLSRLTDDDAQAPVVHPAEEIALLRVLGRLEKALVEPFDPRYREILAAARARLAGDAAGGGRG